MRKYTCQPSLQRRRQGGFALIVVLLLSALLVAMLVALITLTLAETRTLRASAKIQLARTNALIGLQHAVGALQKNAGRDQCATAPANLLDAKAENPWITGAWQQNDGNTTDVAWLISGSKIDEGGAFGTVTPKTSLPDPKSATADTVWLVHSAVGNDAKLSVKAPKIDIKIADPRLPKAAKDALVGGRYAWWASDESVKAKANLSQEPAGWSGDGSEWESRWRIAGAPRTAPWSNDDFGDALPKDAKLARNAISFGQLPLLGTGKGSRDRLTKGFAKHFHSYTAESFGVLSDARNGGLRRDLSLAFELPDDAFFDDEFFGTPKNGFGGDGGINVREVNWRSMRDFYRTYKQMDSSGVLPAKTFTNTKEAGSDAKLRAAATNRFLREREILLPLPDADHSKDDLSISPTTTAVVPRVVRMEHAISVMTKEEKANEEGDGPFKLMVVLDPVATVWNPFNTKLSAEAIRIDDRLPSLHVVVEVRQPWKAEKRYRKKDEVYASNKIYKAIKESKGKSVGDAKYWEEIRDRTWSLGTDVTLRQLLERSSVDRASYVLTLAGTTDGKPEPMVFEPGEFAVFSVSNPAVTLPGDGPLAPAMKRGWNPDGGMGFDRLVKPPEEGEEGGSPEPFLRTYEETEVRVTIEPYRVGSDLYVKNDPFKFIKDYEIETVEKDSEANSKTDDGQEGIAYMPNGYSEYIGEFTGGLDMLGSFAWSATRRGDFIAAYYATRAYLGNEGGGGQKPLPGMGDQMTMQSDKKVYLGLHDWHWKTEADALYPAMPILRFNPRFALVGMSPGTDEKKFGYPCTVPHFQLQLKKITSDKQIIEMDRNFRAFWGPSYTSQGEQQVPLFEVPSAPMLSLGQLQHYQTSLSPIDSGYSIGSSWASPFIARTTTTMETKGTAVNPAKQLVDPSYLLNEQLFDRYYFSSICAYSGSDGVGSRLGAITAEKSPKLLPNARLKLHVPPGVTKKEIVQALDSTRRSSRGTAPYDKAAAFLMVDGPFNVNSTSVEAWKAVLAGMDGLKVPNDQGGVVGPSDNIVSRFSVTNGRSSDKWRGYRSLKDEELTELATKIVAEVRARGPFHSLADFINRRLVDNETGLCGTLQTAINKTAINKHLTAEVTLGALQHAAAQADSGDNPWEFPFPEHAIGPVMAAQPGFVQQGDLLQELAPFLTVRGDTFKVRSYGEVVNPRTGALEARAWCEAIVQRMPEYLRHRNAESNERSREDGGDPPWAAPDKLKDSANKAGRLFKVIRLRWLSPDEV